MSIENSNCESKTPLGSESGELPPDLPVVAERIDNAPDTPTVLLDNRKNLLGPGSHSSSEDSVGIANGENNPDGDPAKGFWTEIEVLRRFVT